MTVLDDIIAGVREDLEARRREVPLTAIVEAAARAEPVRTFDLEIGRAHV